MRDQARTIATARKRHLRYSFGHLEDLSGRMTRTPGGRRAVGYYRPSKDFDTGPVPIGATGRDKLRPPMVPSVCKTSCMPLEKCTACGGPVGSGASSCPACGEPTARRNSNIVRAVVLVALAVLVILVVKKMKDVEQVGVAALALQFAYPSFGF